MSLSLSAADMAGQRGPARRPDYEMSNLLALPPGTVLERGYKITRVLGAGGFGITYLAEQMALKRLVTIKEYFPSDFAARRGESEAVPRSRGSEEDFQWGLERFIEEARTLARFDHPNIVRVHDHFSANGTGYMVIAYEEGGNLKGWLTSLARTPRQSEVDGLLKPLLDALEYIHSRDFLHRDIAPDNIILRKDGSPVLIDFGSARGDVAKHVRTMSALVKPGYSPMEQYALSGARQGPWTDIYSLAATLYQAVTGKRPQDAPSRIGKDDLVPAREAAISSYRPGFLSAIDRALSLKIEQRPQSVAAWREELFRPAPKPARLRFGLGGGTKDEPAADPALVAAGIAPVNQGKPSPAAPSGKAAKAAKPEAVEVVVDAPPPPDMPGHKGRLINFIEGLKRKPGAESEAEKPAALDVAPAAAPDAAAKAKDEPKKARAGKPAPAAAKPADVAVKAPEPPAPAKPKVDEDRRAPPRPRRAPVTWSRRLRLRPLIANALLLLITIATVVALQDRGAKTVSRGTSLVTSQGTDTKAAGVIKGHRGAVTGLAASVDGRHIVSAGADGTIRIWNGATGTHVRTIEVDHGPVTALAIAGDRALTGHGEGAMVLWNLVKAERLAVYKRNDASIWSVAFLGSGERAAAASHDWTIGIFDAANAAAAPTLLQGHESAVHALAFSPATDLIASGGADRKVKLWRADSLDLVRTYGGHRDFVTAIAFSGNGRALAAGCLDGSVRIWSAQSGQLMRSIRGHRGRIHAVAFAPEGSTFATGGEDGVIRLWDLRSGRGRPFGQLDGHPGGTRALAFHPDGKRLISAGEDGAVRLWDLAAVRRANRG